MTLLAPTLYSASLQSDYSVYTTEFNASAIDPSIEQDFTIFRFEDNRHQKSFTASQLLELFAKKGIILQDKSRGIVHIEHLSTIDLSPIKKAIKDHYIKHLPQLNVQGIRLETNGYIDSLPKEYVLDFRPNAHFYHKSSLRLSSKTSPIRHFFTYQIDATITLFKARHNINRGKILTPIDLSYKEVAFNRLKGMPLQKFDRGRVRLKKRIVKGKILYQHDVERLPDVLKDKPVNVRLIDGKVRLEFQAVSLQDAHIGEFILIKKSDGKRLKAKVIDQNMVEIE